MTRAALGVKSCVRHRERRGERCQLMVEQVFPKIYSPLEQTLDGSKLPQELMLFKTPAKWI